MSEFKFFRNNVPLIYPILNSPLYNVNYLKLLEKDIEKDFNEITLDNK
jgi:hypothetical protein